MAHLDIKTGIQAIKNKGIMIWSSPRQVKDNLTPLDNMARIAMR